MADSELAVGALVSTWGAVVTAWIAVKTARAARTRIWPTAIGVITASTIQEGPSAGMLIPVARYRAAIAYQYEIDGRVLSGTRITMDESQFESRPWAEDRLRRYPLSATVRVSYDPGDPSRAVLQPGISTEHMQGLGAGLLFLVVGVLAVLHAVL